MSELNVTPKPWRAYPSKDTTLRQLEAAILAFPELVLDVAPITFEISLKLGFDEDPPPTDELAAVLYPLDENLIVSETGTFPALEARKERIAIEKSFEAEAADRNAEGA